MKRTVLFISVLLTIVFLVQSAFTWKPAGVFGTTPDITPDSLRRLYERPISEWPAPWVEAGVAWEELAALEGRTADYEEVMATPLVQLGKMLFFDPILSGSNQISCSTCHMPEHAWADPLSVSLGHDQLAGTRNTPSILNVKDRKTLFWDGRVSFLEEQALGPLETHHEMNMDLTRLIPKLKAIPAYNQLFIAAFGEENYSMPEVLSALAAFQRTVVSRPSRFDSFLQGQKDALSTKEIHGLHLFRTQARCMNCHHGPHFTDEEFHFIGLHNFGDEQPDLGRYDITAEPGDIGKFRTPSLRDVMHTSPWMHTGQFSNMRQILNLYNTGTMNGMGQSLPPVVASQPTIDPLMKRLHLSSREISAIEAFLHAISSEPYAFSAPKSMPR